MGRMDPTPHVGMINRGNNLEEETLTNVSIYVNFIVVHFATDPTRMRHWSLFQQLPNTQRRGLPPPHTHTHTHTKQKEKEQLKLQTPKTTLTKEGGQKNQKNRKNLNPQNFIKKPTRNSKKKEKRDKFIYFKAQKMETRNKTKYMKPTISRSTKRKKTIQKREKNLEKSRKIEILKLQKEKKENQQIFLKPNKNKVEYFQLQKIKNKK